MSFTWTTARAGGGSFAAGAVTSFETPALTYPNGYTVTVTGGRMTSARRASVLTVAADAGATTITVVVQPAGG